MDFRFAGRVRLPRFVPVPLPLVHKQVDRMLESRVALHTHTDSKAWPPYRPVKDRQEFVGEPSKILRAIEDRDYVLQHARRSGQLVRVAFPMVGEDIVNIKSPC